MAEKVLITGGAGFIGCELGADLAAQGHEVVAFDNLHPQVHADPRLPARLSPHVKLVPADVTVGSNFHALFKYFRPDVVVHLAAETGTGQSLTEATRHAMVNVTGTTQLLDALTAAKHVPRKILLSSSRAVYGDGAWQTSKGDVFYPAGRTRQALEKHEWDFPGPDGTPARPLPHDAAVTRPNPVSIYGATKLAQEQILAAWCRAFGSALSVLRLQNVYGPGQAPQNAYTGVLTLFVRLARARTALEVYEDGVILRDFVHVKDVVQAMTKSLARQALDQTTIDIGSGQPITIHEVAKKIAAIFDAPPPVVSEKYRDGDVRAASCDIAMARSTLGYEPRISVDKGLATFVAENQP